MTARVRQRCFRGDESLVNTVDDLTTGQNWNVIQFQRSVNEFDRGKSSPSSMYPPIGISDEDRETFKETRDPMILIELTIDMYVVPVNTGGYFAIEWTPGYEDTRPPYFEYLSDVQKTQKIILKTFRGKMKITVINRHTTDSDIDARHTGVHLNSLGDALHDVMLADRDRSRIARKQCSSLFQIQTCSFKIRSLLLKTTMTSITNMWRLSPSNVSSMKKWTDSRDMTENVYVSREEALHDLIRTVIGVGENCQLQTLLSTKSTHPKRIYIRRIIRHWYRLLLTDLTCRCKGWSDPAWKSCSWTWKVVVLRLHLATRLFEVLWRKIKNAKKKRDSR